MAKGYPVVLIVDEDERIRSAFQRAARGLPVLIFGAESAREALRVVEQQEPSLVVMEQLLPDATAQHLLERLRARAGHMPEVVLYTWRSPIPPLGWPVRHLEKPCSAAAIRVLLLEHARSQVA